MSYRNLQECVQDLEANGHLVRIDAEVDPHLELAAIQRRAFRAKAPALLFTRVKGTPFPMLSNLFGTRERLHFIFRRSLPAVEAVLAAKADPAAAIKRPLQSLKALPGLINMLPQVSRVRAGQATAVAPVLQCRCKLADLPQLVCWPMDGGPFITLPLVYSEDPAKPGADASNLGMYRVQLGGNEYGADEVGLHYQIHRGIGAHHARALEMGKPLPVHIYVGGPPSLTVAAVMPLPEGLSELRFAGLLGGRRTEMASVEGLPLPVLAQADFLHQRAYLARVQARGPLWRPCGLLQPCARLSCAQGRCGLPSAGSHLALYRRGPSPAGRHGFWRLYPRAHGAAGSAGFSGRVRRACRGRRRRAPPAAGRGQRTLHAL